MSQRVLITGAGTGLGLETALLLAKHNFEVFAGVLTTQQQVDVCAQASAHNVKVHTLLLDVTDEAGMASALAPVFANGGLYAVVHSAGISLRGYFEDCDDDEIRRVLDVNLFGAMSVTRVVLPHMRQAGRGHLLFISSIGGRIASMARTAYCASKFALEGFAESLLQEMIPFGIHVSIIEPAIIKTERWTVNRGLARRAMSSFSPYLKWFQKEEELADKLVQSSPTKPIDVAEQIHQALLSPRPKHRYVVGKRAMLVLRLRRYLPSEFFEKLYFGEAMRRITASHPSDASLGVRASLTPNGSPASSNRLLSLVGAFKVLGLPALLQASRAKKFNDRTIRGYYMTTAIMALLNIGFLEEIAEHGSVNLAEFAERRNFDLKTLQIVADYLYIQRFLAIEHGAYVLDADGKMFDQTLTGAFYIVHAYEGLFQNLEGIIRREKKFNVDIFRDPEAMDVGSGLIGLALAFPFMCAEIMHQGLERVLDIGCGDASFLTYLCKDNPQITGYGLDIEPKGILRGQERLKHEHLQDRVKLVIGDLFHLGLGTACSADGRVGGPTGAGEAIQVVTMIYVLHELRELIVPALRKIHQALPNATVMLCEVIRHSPETLHERPGGLSEIQFFHELSNQRLFTREEWQDIFREAGAVNVEENYLAFARTAIFSVRW